MSEASCEASDCPTFGAVIVIDGVPVEQFGGLVPQFLSDRWSSKGTVQPIFETELLPVLVARRVWCKLLAGSCSLWFIDNDAARGCCVKMSSKNPDGNDILWEMADDEIVSPCRPWYSRVSSAGNLGDAPSRLDFESVACRRIDVRVEYFSIAQRSVASL